MVSEAVPGPVRSCRRAVLPQPACLRCERLGQEQGGEHQDRGGHRVGEDLSARHHEDDSLDDRHGLGPEARRGSPSPPRPHDGGERLEISRQPDEEHPLPGRRGDVPAQQEHQERVDLHVEPRSQVRRRAGAPGHPPIDPVQAQGDCRDRHEHGRLGAGGDEGRHAPDEGAASQGDHVGRSRRLVPAGQTERQEAGNSDPAGEAGRPSRAGEAHRRVQGDQNQDLRSQPGDGQPREGSTLNGKGPVSVPQVSRRPHEDWNDDGSQRGSPTPGSPRAPSGRQAGARARSVPSSCPGGGRTTCWCGPCAQE